MCSERRQKEIFVLALGTINRGLNFFVFPFLRMEQQYILDIVYDNIKKKAIVVLIFRFTYIIEDFMKS